MKRFMVAILFLLMTITYLTTPGCNAQAANQMLAQISYFTITDDITPYMQNLTPAEGTAIDPNDFTIGFDILDVQTGIDLPTVVVTSSIGEVSMTNSPIENGYHVDITITGLSYGQSITIDITAEDLAN